MKTIWCDGSGFNGERSGYAIACDDGSEPVIVWEPIDKTNNEREYEAVLTALRDIASKGDQILTDSQLVVNQVNGKWKLKEPKLFSLCVQCKKLLAEKKCTLKWIGRNDNMAGHLLEKKG